MKQLTNTIAACALLAMVCIVETGCGTTPATKMAQANQLVITTVNDGVQEFVDAANRGKMKQSQIDAFKKSYNIYYAAQQALRAVNIKLAIAETDKSVVVTQAELDLGKQSVTDAENALLALLNSYLR